jgi:hypothetical protein
VGIKVLFILSVWLEKHESKLTAIWHIRSSLLWFPAQAQGYCAVYLVNISHHLHYPALVVIWHCAQSKVGIHNCRLHAYQQVIGAPFCCDRHAFARVIGRLVELDHRFDRLLTPGEIQKYKLCSVFKVFQAACKVRE